MADEIQLDVVNEINESSMEKRSWIVEINDELSNMESIPKKEKQAVKGERSIYKLPANIRRNFDPYDYKPQKVSFGPYHHDHDSCKQTQQIKKHAVLHFLKRNNQKIDNYVKFLREVVQYLKDAYDELDSKWQDDDDFLQLMIYDGCFFLEILYGERALDRHDHGSPVWGIDGISPEELNEYYRHDMMLLENQIPMLALEVLAAVQAPKSQKLAASQAHTSLEESGLQFMKEVEEELHNRILSFISGGNRTLTRKQHVRHVLDLYRHSLLSNELSASRTLSGKVCSSCIGFLDKVHKESTKAAPSPSRCIYRIIRCLLSPMFLVYWRVLRIRIHRLRTQSRLTHFHINIQSATELEKVGIGITTRETMSLKDFSFRHRTLTVPPILLDGTTKSRVLNIIAFEQVHDYHEKEVFSYFYFMSRLVQSADDAQLLQSRGIVHGPFLVKEVPELFNSLIKDIVNDPDNSLVFRYRYVARELAKSFYYKMNNSLQKDLWQNYLKSPLGVFSLIAAFLLFALTVVQTVYTVLGYYNPK